jgi:peptide chain release factor 2
LNGIILMHPSQLIKYCQQRSGALQEAIPVRTHKDRIAQIDETMLDPTIWDDNRKAAALLKERQQLTSVIEELQHIVEQSAMLFEYIESFPDEVESFNDQIVDLDKTINTFELSQIFTEEADDSPAILTISAGAGGLEAANWVSILLRMYGRYADAHGFKMEMLDLKPSEEHSAICIDSVSIRIDGENAYGFLKGESGVHRLIRNSPFNSGDARHTSFAAISVLPDIEDKIDIVIEDKDIEIQATRSGGSGGQAVNKISSCIILKHIPSGILIRSQTEASQLANRKIAFKLLKSKLYDLEIKKKEAENDKLIGAQANNAFGSQIRTVTMSPYSLVKDHRSDCETNQIDKYLDGDIKEFLISYLRSK